MVFTKFHKKKNNNDNDNLVLLLKYIILINNNNDNFKLNPNLFEELRFYVYVCGNGVG